MKWNKFRLKTTTEAEDIVSSMLMDLGVQGIEIEDKIPMTQAEKEQMFVDILPETGINDGIAYISFYLEEDEDKESLLEAVKNELEDMRAYVEVGEGTIEESQTEDVDWVNNWKKYFKPLPIGDKLLIQPTWLDDEKTDRLMLHIDPGLAFGTGGHNTTKLCLEQLEKVINPGMNILDVGCGSGILSIASLLLGAKSATGVDIDALAVKTAIENGKINNLLYPEYNMIQGDLTDKISGQYDIIVANIVADIIIRLCKDIKQYMHAGSLFIVSGIVDIREDDVTTAFYENGLDIVSRNEEGGWVCFTLKKK